MWLLLFQTIGWVMPSLGWVLSLVVCLVPEMLTELARREKAANIKPDHDIDVYMKVRLLQILRAFCA